jgi:hypothetical protein
MVEIHLLLHHLVVSLKLLLVAGMGRHLVGLVQEQVQVPVVVVVAANLIMVLVLLEVELQVRDTLVDMQLGPLVVLQYKVAAAAQVALGQLQVLPLVVVLVGLELPVYFRTLDMVNV